MVCGLWPPALSALRCLWLCSHAGGDLVHVYVWIISIGAALWMHGAWISEKRYHNVASQDGWMFELRRGLICS